MVRIRVSTGFTVRVDYPIYLYHFLGRSPSYNYNLQTGRRRYYARLVIRYDIFKTNEPILVLISTSGPQGKGIKRSTVVVRRSKVMQC